ncbi:MAG: homoaconitase, partial [Gemmatimonadetes bacterium]|nr:homoaconitase [Gemmatimonadota bacterium]
DGIYGKDVTYRDDITFEQQGQHAMLNYDPAFQQIAAEGDIIVGGRNFGSGSSREQAATALASRGVRLVIAASAGQTYKRNAFNNGFPLVECAELVTFLRERFASDSRKTIRTGLAAEVDFRASTLRAGDRTFRFAPLGEVPQQLVIAGGAEKLVRRQLEGIAE